MADRTSYCKVCGAAIANGQFGRPASTCNGCTVPKLARQRERRHSGPSSQSPCSQCAKMLPRVRPLPNSEIWCGDCGPGPGVTRKSTCLCGASFFRTPKGGHTVAGRVALCDQCAETLKWCSTCDKVRPRGEFALARDKADGRAAKCTECRNTGAGRHQVTAHRAHRLKRFNLTVADYERMLDSQDARCAICGVREEDCVRRLAVDHDHDCCSPMTACSQCVRALLCVRCNAGLGYFRDDVDVMLAAVEYLRRHKAERTPSVP